MTVTIDNTGGTGNTTDQQATRSFSMTLAGSNLAAFLMITGNLSATPTTCTCGGVEMDLIGSTISSILYGILDPGIGSKSFSATFSVAKSSTMRAISFNGVNQVTGWGTGQTNTSAGADNLTVSSITAVVNSYVVGCGHFSDVSDTVSSVTDGSYFGEYTNTFGSRIVGFGMYKVASSTTESIQYNLTGSASLLSGVAVGIIPAAAGGMLAFF